jgi:hypothetical protein
MAAVFDRAKARAAFLTAFARLPTDAELARLEGLARRCQPHVTKKQARVVEAAYTKLNRQLPRFSSDADHHEISWHLEALRKKLPRPSTKPSNKGRALEFSEFVWSIMRFYSEHRYPVNSDDEVCVEFVKAIATEPLRAKGWKVTNTTIRTLIREELHDFLRGADMTVGSPEIGAPVLAQIPRTKPDDQDQEQKI